MVERLQGRHKRSGPTAKPDARTDRDDMEPLVRFRPTAGVLPQPRVLEAAGRARMLVALQRLYGNRAVQRLVADGATPTVQRDSVEHVAHPTLRWQDFKGKPNGASSYDAATYSRRTGLSMRGKATKTGGAWTAEATLDASSLDLRASMDRGRSWVRKGKQSADLLRHEQGHFDVQHVLVEKGETAIRAVATGVTGTGTASRPKKALKLAFADLQTTAPFTKLAGTDRVIAAAHNDYDEHPTLGTDHGTKPAQQAQWEADIAADLPGYPVR